MGVIPRIAAAILQDRTLAKGQDDPQEGKTVRYTVEFRNHGTDHMSVFLTKSGANDGENVQTTDHSMASDLLSAIVDFEANASAAQNQHPGAGAQEESPAAVL